MPDITLTVNLDKSVSIDNNFLAVQGEQITVELNMDSALAALGYDAYVDFLLPTGDTCFKGAYDCSSGTISFTLGASDSVLDKDGDVFWQLVLATTVGSVRTPYWKSLMGETKILPSINATSSAVLPYVPQMEYPDNYPAELIELADVADVITATNVEDSFQEIATNIDTIETNVGTLLYTENNYITDSEPLTTSVDKLDMTLKDTNDYALSGWIPVTGTLTYASASTITVASGAESRYQKGDKIKWTQTTVKYGVIVAVADTLITIAPNSDYVVTNAAISNVYISRIASPFGFPVSFAYTGTVTAQTGTPTSVTNACKYSIQNGLLTIMGTVQIQNAGSAADQLRLTTPVQSTSLSTGLCQETAAIGDSGTVRVSDAIAYLVFEQYSGATWWVTGYALYFCISYFI